MENHREMSERISECLWKNAPGTAFLKILLVDFLRKFLEEFLQKFLLEFSEKFQRKIPLKISDNISKGMYSEMFKDMYEWTQAFVAIHEEISYSIPGTIKKNVFF